MWVSRKEFDKLKEYHRQLTMDWIKLDNRIKEVDRAAFNARNDVDTLTKQVGCSCENYEVVIKDEFTVLWHDCSGRAISARNANASYTKHCLDCGWTTTYDTEEDALEDKQALLDKQQDALKEQKKSLKKK